MADAFLPGFALGSGLILAIGAQNAFVLRQGLLRSHVFAVCLTCAASDVVLIAIGVTSFTAGVQGIALAAPGLPVWRRGGAGPLRGAGLSRRVDG